MITSCGTTYNKNKTENLLMSGTVNALKRKERETKNRVVTHAPFTRILLRNQLTESHIQTYTIYIFIYICNTLHRLERERNNNNNYKAKGCYVN